MGKIVEIVISAKRAELPGAFGAPITSAVGLLQRHLGHEIEESDGNYYCITCRIAHGMKRLPQAYHEPVEVSGKIVKCRCGKPPQDCPTLQANLLKTSPFVPHSVKDML